MRGSSWSLESLTLCLVARLQRLLNELQHAAVGDLLSELRTHLRELANERKRFGYRRLFVLLRQQGEPSGINRIYRSIGRKALPCASGALDAAP